jgi:DNA-binding GntR family transcriptional regulator
MPVNRHCIHDQVRETIVERILDGTYRPGDRLVELQLARELHTSQGPVREALRELEALRLVETQRFCGTRVRRMTYADLRESIQVRAALEQMAAPVAAMRMKKNTAALEKEMEHLRKAARARDLKAYARHNMNFHRQIVEAAGNATLLRMWDSLALELSTRLNLTRTSIDMRKVVEAHQPILDALHRGNGEQAARLLRRHVDGILSQIPTRTSHFPPPRIRERAGTIRVRDVCNCKLYMPDSLT